KGIPAFNQGEKEYELSVATANLLYRFTRPECVVQPETTEHVQYIVEQARDVGEDITVKCGGHSYTGFSTADHGLLIDLKRMTAVKLQLSKDKTPTAVKVQAGARWGDVYRTLINGSHRGYVINGGRCPSVGVSGFLLGGGLGPFTRSFGMGSDTVIEATIVTADGKKVTVGKDSPPGSREAELFWALRGAGCGTFGVVTEFKMDVKKLKNKNVVAGRYLWTPTAGVSHHRTMQQILMADWPKEMTIDNNWMLDVKGGKGEMGIRFTIYYDGPKDEFDKLLDEKMTPQPLDGSLSPEDRVKLQLENADQENLIKQLKRRSMPEPSTRFLYESLVLMWDEEARNSLPRPGDNAYQKYSSFCFRTDREEDARAMEEIIRIVTAQQTFFKDEFKTDNASFWVTFIHSGGKATTFSRTETAYPWRECTFHTYITIKWTDKWLEQNATGFLLRMKDILKPYSMNGQASFINFSDAAIAKDHDVAYYGENSARARKVKSVWDKDNYFNWP
ncbi:FAD-binding domain-containing protein, partial [Pseudovirgaria hyperparasitica]